MADSEIQKTRELGGDNDFSFEVLPELVSESDDFDGGTHQHAADSLYEIISTQQQNLTIGLEGSWGSGKSTVINLLRKKILKGNTKNDRVALFSFDAWAHSGNSLRKAFLAGLVISLIKQNPVLSRDLIKIKTSLLEPTRKIRITGSKTTTDFATLLSITALMIPISAGILSGIDYAGLVAPWSPSAGAPNLALLSGIFVGVAPLCALLLYWKIFRREKSGDPENPGKWSLIKEVNQQETDETISFDREPTSVEFELVFTEILQTIFIKNQISQLVIVLDNLDRIEATDLKNVWATIQTFFQQRSNPVAWQRKSWSKNLKFLVPFDRDNFAELWKESFSKIRLTDADDEPIPKATFNSRVPNEVQSFLEKSFQVTIEVPPLYPSGWREYLVQCLNEALTGWCSTEKDRALVVLTDLLSEQSTPPTPRLIKGIINRATPIKRRWRSTISTEAVFSYAFYRHFKSGTAFRDALLGSDL